MATKVTDTKKALDEMVKRMTTEQEVLRKLGQQQRGQKSASTSGATKPK